MKGNIISVGSYGSTIYLGIVASKTALKNLRTAMCDLKLDYADEIGTRIDSKHEPIDNFDPAIYLDEHMHVENKKVKVHIVTGKKKLHVIAELAMKDRSKFMDVIEKYFEVAKPKK